MESTASSSAAWLAAVSISSDFNSVFSSAVAFLWSSDFAASAVELSESFSVSSLAVVSALSSVSLASVAVFRSAAASSVSDAVAEAAPSASKSFSSVSAFSFLAVSIRVLSLSEGGVASDAVFEASLLRSSRSSASSARSATRVGTGRASETVAADAVPTLRAARLFFAMSGEVALAETAAKVRSGFRSG